jgi:hypothetical protein
MTSPKKPGLAFWAGVALVVVLVYLLSYRISWLTVGRWVSSQRGLSGT